MSAVAKIGLTIAAFAAVGLSGCMTTQTNLTSSAERLENSAIELQSDARDEGATDSYYRDAQEFASEARDFRRIIEDRHADRDDVGDAFKDLSRRYHALRDEVERARDRAAELDFKPVTEAYLDVEREMRSYGNHRDRYARDDD